jgi:hypothetical protein
MRAGRPFSIIALAVLAAAGGIWVLGAVAGLRPVDQYPFGSIKLGDDVARAIALVWGVVLLISAILIALLNRWGWAVLMVVTGIGLLAALWQWWIGNPEPVRLAIFVVTAFYLNAREVRDLLLTPTGRAGSVPLPPAEVDGQ